MDTESSAESQPLLEAEAENTLDVNAAAESSPAASEGEKSTFDVVKAALNPTEESPASDEPGKAAKAEAPKTEAEDEPLADPTEEDLRRYKPETAKRMRQILAQRDETKRALDDLRPKAETADKLNGFLAEKNLSPDDLNVVLDIAATIRNDPMKGYERLMAIAEQLKPMVGQILPNDLQEQVNLGYITEAHARETARLRAQTQLQESRAQQDAQRRDAEQNERQRAALVSTVSQAATDWERSVQRTDPDYPLKQQRITELVELEVRRKGFPTNAQAVVDMSKRAYEQVNKELKALRPAPREIKPAVGAASSRAMPEPKSTMDVIRQALGN